MRPVCIAVLAGAAALVVAAQKPPLPTFRVESHLVNLAVVATDRAGKPIRDLRAGDLILTENGQSQKLLTFENAAASPRARDAASTRSPATPGVSYAAVAGGERLRYLAFVFDNSDTDFRDRQRAVAAVRAWLARDLSPDDLVALLTVGSSVRLWQVFTNDRHLLNEGLGRIAANSTPLTMAPVNDMLGAMRQCLAMGLPMNRSANRVVNPIGIAELQCGEGVAQQYQLRVTAELGQRESVLDDLVYAMHAFPGEKRLVYLGDGFRLNPGRLAYFAYRMYFGNDLDTRTRAVGANSDYLSLLTSAAVRAHVTFDTIDAHGLRADAPTGNADRNDPPLIKNGLNDADPANPSLQQLAQDFDHEAVHGTEDSLAELAADTGGRAFFGAGDLSRAIEQAVGDYEGTYLISYRPTDQRLDGRYRAIALRSLRAGVHLATRRGYYADPVKTIPITARAAPPIPSGGRWQVPVACTLPAAAMVWQAGKHQAARDTLVAVRTLLDPRGQVLAGSVEVFAPSQPADGKVLYQADTIVPAGDYTYLITLTETKTSNFASVTLPIHVGAPRVGRAAATQPAALAHPAAAPAASLLERARELMPRDCRGALRLLAEPAAGGSAAVHELRARCLEQQGERQRAAFEDERALALGDDTAEIHASLGRYYLALSPLLARAHLQRAVALDPVRAPSLDPLIEGLTPLPSADANRPQLEQLKAALAASAARFENRFSQAAATETLDERVGPAEIQVGARPPRVVVIESRYAVVRGGDGRFTEFRSPIRVDNRYLSADATQYPNRGKLRRRPRAEFARYDLTHHRFQGLAFALTLLDAAHQRGLAFSGPESRAMPGGPAWELGFHTRPNVAQPALSTLGPQLEGHVWVDAATHRPIRLEVISAQADTIMTFDVRYEYSAKLGCLVPREIHASDVLPDREGDQLAFHYADFQRFGSRATLRLLH